MKIVFIRHGKTLGNLDKKYIGSTDEPLCEEGIAELSAVNYPTAARVVTSPMLRCMQTAELIYPTQKHIVYDDLRECDFGDFEGKNYSELCDNPAYQKWLDSGGKIAFPNGEARKTFSERSCNAFEKAVRDNANCGSMAFVVHGGTIMSVLEKYAVPKRDFYDYQVKNGGGYIAECDEKTLTIKIISEIK